MSASMCVLSCSHSVMRVQVVLIVDCGLCVSAATKPFDMITTSRCGIKHSPLMSMLVMVASQTMQVPVL
jgi:hypothetical protein